MKIISIGRCLGLKGAKWYNFVLTIEQPHFNDIQSRYLAFVRSCQDVVESGVELMSLEQWVQRNYPNQHEHVKWIMKVSHEKLMKMYEDEVDRMFEGDVEGEWELSLPPGPTRYH